jgi:hypothetical protein
MHPSRAVFRNRRLARIIPDFQSRIIAGMIVLLLAGCAPRVGAVTSTPTQMVATYTTAPTITQVPATPSPSPTDTPTTLPSVTPTLITTATPEAVCMPVVDSLSPGFMSPGTVLFDAMRTKHGLYSLSSPDLDAQPFWVNLPKGVIGNYIVSPDHKWVAFEQEIDSEQAVLGKNLVLMTSDARTRKSIPWDEENWGALLTWLADSQRLIIIPIDHSQFVETPVDILVYNPFSGQQQKITPSFKYSKDYLPVEWWKSIGLSVVYDPTLTRVAYLDSDYSNLVLWDLEKKQELWRYIDPDVQTITPPVWSPDGSTLAVVSLMRKDVNQLDLNDDFQILLVSRDGVVSRSKPFPFYLGLNPYTLTWSPDGRYLSFSWQQSIEAVWRLFVLDTTTNVFLDPCLEDVDSDTTWSPNGQQFIVWIKQPGSPPGKGIDRNVLVDLKEGMVVRLDNIEYAPVAWLNTEP